jgi:hypothetical protein
MQRRCLAALLLASAFVPAPLFAQTARVPTVTRLVKLFLDLESELLLAQRNGDRAALERRLADDFELRVGAKPGEPVPRADWLDNALAHKPPWLEIEQMAVHEQGTSALVSFLLRPRGAHEVPTLVVDSWVRSGDDWRLAVRYAAPVPPNGPRVIGEGAPSAPLIRKRY